MILFNNTSFDAQRSVKNVLQKSLASGNTGMKFPVYLDRDYKARSNAYFTISPISFDFSNTKINSFIKDYSFAIKFYYRKANVNLGSASSKRTTLEIINKIVEKVKQIFIENKEFVFINDTRFGDLSTTFGATTKRFTFPLRANNASFSSFTGISFSNFDNRFRNFILAQDSKMFNIQITDIDYNPSRTDAESRNDLNMVTMSVLMTMEDLLRS
tara:strand:- start:504 stop:1145 length:642 start_codon:yes stop_codon:yes gene_type:complete